MTLIELIIERKGLAGKGITFLEGSGREEFFSYEELYTAALRALYYLQESGIAPGHEVVLQVESNKDFVIVFWACILGGIIPVPLSTGHSEESRTKLFNVWEVLSNPYLVTGAQNLGKISVLARSRGLEEKLAHIESRLINITAVQASQHNGSIFNARENDIAFVQFSSGSTGNPKGVILTHRNLIRNMEAISQAGRYTSEDSMISWMPLTHDMGLIGFHLNPLYSGMNQYLIPTSLFIRRPSLWIDKTSVHKISIMCSPNFGYRYLMKHMGTGHKNWDLSGVRILYNGAEPISDKICREFLDHFEVYGLKRTSMCPVYGLAEATLAASFSDPEAEIISLHIDRTHMRPGDEILIREEGENPVTFVNVGRPVSYCTMRIVNNEGVIVDDETIGHIQISGENVTRGYYNNPTETDRLITADGWLSTGDMGFMSGDSLYITGRYKDIIFLNGENHYPHDIERIAEEIAGIELNRIAVAGFFNSDTQREEVIAFVLYRGDIRLFIQLMYALKAHVNNKAGINLDQVIPVQEIPKTTSGKLQRFKLLERFKAGDFLDVQLELASLAEEQQTSREFEAQPDDESEQKLLDIWREVTGNKNITVADKFLETGGDSLKLMEMRVMLMKELEVELPAEMLYRVQTIRDLSREINFLKKQQYPIIPVVEEQEYYPVSSAQRRIYYAWALAKNAISYNNPVVLKIDGVIEAERLEACIRKIIIRHDALRMSFHLVDGPQFRVQRDVLFFLDLGECDRNRLDEMIRQYIQPFDLASVPLFRIRLLKVAEEEYFLFLDFHHIISDGISIYYFIEELFNAYYEIELPALPVQYRDYACWENNARNSGKTEAARAYWMNYLQGELPVLELLADFTRPAVLGTAGAKAFFGLNGRERDLARIAGENGCSLHQVLFTLYNILLSKYTGKEDILTGIPVAGRYHADLRRLHGMFVNNLPVISRIKGEMPFRQLLMEEKENIAHALIHQDYPFDELVRELNVKRDASRNPVFDSMFIYQNMGFPKVGNSALRISRYPFDPGFSKFDISLEVFEEAGDIQCAFEYNTKLFKPTTVSELINRLNALVEQIIEKPDSPVARLSILSTQEYQTYIYQFNGSTFDYRKDMPIHRLFECIATSMPGNVAIEYRNEEITYQQLNDRSNRLAYLLRQRGINENNIVGILIERSPALITGILGILKAGAAYLPIDKELPKERIDFMLADSRCQLLLVQGGIDGHLFHTEIIDLERLDPASDTFPDDNGTIDCDNTAYIIYTSGTTGHPKGVMITHRSLTNYISWAANTYIRKEKVAFPLFTSISFDLTLTSIFTPLITGNKIVVYEEDHNKPVIENIVNDNKVDVIKLTPSHLRLLRNISLPVSGCSIRRFIVGGEDLSTQLASDIYDRFNGNIEIYNEYGPTEATVGCMIHRFEKGYHSRSVPIGVPSGNMQIYLLDSFLVPVPAGVPGEIYISGDGLSKGYLNQEEMTKRKFIPNPFLKGQKMYKTGDIARRLPDGYLEFLGRMDEQVKINGYRIELPEIRTHIVAYKGITDALLVVQKNENDQGYLCAYYIADKEIDEFSLKNFLAGKLPYYMVPARLIRIYEMPLTNNGKIDYDSLPDPGTPLEAESGSLPENDLQLQLLEAWRDIFQTAVSVNDNFFQLGGDSIKALQLSSRLLQGGIYVSVKDILIYHTISQISRHAETAVNNNYDQGITSGNRALNPVESWFFQQGFRNPDYYNQSVLLSAKRRLDPGLLELSFRKLIKHHDGLRMNYDSETHTLFYNNDHLDEPFVIGQYSLQSGAESGPELIRICEKLKSEFDIRNSCLLKAAILQKQDAPDLLFITAHHLVVDGISWRIILEDLYSIYQAAEAGKAISLPAKTASSTEWRKCLDEHNDYRELGTAHWKEPEHSDFEIPLDFEAADWRVSNLHHISGELDSECTAFLLKESYRAYSTTADVLLVAALVMALKEWTGSRQIAIELETHGRHLTKPDISRTVGWFTVMCPVAFVQPDDDIGGCIKAVRAKLLDLPRQGIAYGTRYYMNGAVKGNEKLKGVRFNYLGQFDRELDTPLFSYEHQSTGSDIALCNQMTAMLDLNLIIIGGKLRVDISYNRTAHKDDTIRWFRDLFFSYIKQTQQYFNNGGEPDLFYPDFTVNLDSKDLDALFA